MKKAVKKGEKEWGFGTKVVTDELFLYLCMASAALVPLVTCQRDVKVHGKHCKAVWRKHIMN